MTTKPNLADMSLTRSQLLERATGLVPTLRERAALTEELRRVPAETVDDLLASGLLLIGVPERFGGLGDSQDADVDYGLSLEVGIELARGLRFHLLVLLPLGGPFLAGGLLAPDGAGRGLWFLTRCPHIQLAQPRQVHLRPG